MNLSIPKGKGRRPKDPGWR